MLACATESLSRWKGIVGSEYSVATGERFQVGAIYATFVQTNLHLFIITNVRQYVVVIPTCVE